jgi:hypothetical protein
MTLVVGQVTPDIRFLIADTLLSFEKYEARKTVQKSHALKIHILNPDTAVAFAGDVATSLNIIANLNAELRADPQMSLCDRLFELYKERSRDCDFLVLQLAAEGKNLAHITSERLSYRNRAYIGDCDEYKRMMELRHPYDPPKMQMVQQPDGTFHTVPLVTSEGEREFEEISRALEELTGRRAQGRQQDSVGTICGCIVRVVNARISGKLEYLQSGEVSISPWEGKSGFTFLASNSDIRGIGIYYRSGKMGFLFIVGDSEYCRQEYAETLNQFVAMARMTYGLTLTGVGFDC